MSGVDRLLANARQGRTADIARLLTIVENDEPGAAEAIRETFADGGRATLVGLTGPPGAGKSTLTSALTAAWRKAGARVAVVAVDPSSPLSGGALLGDRIRMRERFLDDGVFIRSMANRGVPGGLARATHRVVGLLDALGFDIVLVETVGVGQQDADVARLVDTVCLLTIPGSGDDIQAIKAGILEVADILVVNKGDRPGADEAVRDLRKMQSLGGARPGWQPPVVKTSAVEGTGVDDLIEAIAMHRAWGAESGEARRRTAEAIRSEVTTLLRERALRDLERRLDPGAMDDVLARVADKTLDPYAAVEALLGREP
jgi:LAO/AO transport system kinase